MSSLKDYKHKQERRQRRRASIRRKVYGVSEKPRLTVFRSHKNISCQVIDDSRGFTLASASTSQQDLRKAGSLTGSGGNCKAAEIVGEDIAKKALALGIQRVEFDRNGYRFHGRVRALAEAARKAGLRF
jgi:large subunit ribosomal protein L18